MHRDRTGKSHYRAPSRVCQGEAIPAVYHGERLTNFGPFAVHVTRPALEYCCIDPIHWVRSISFPGSTLVCPWFVRSNSFEGIPGAHPGQPWVPYLSNRTGRLGLARGAWRHHVRASYRSISSCRGAHPMSTAGSTRVAPDWTHTMIALGKQAVTKAFHICVLIGSRWCSWQTLPGTNQNRL